MSFIKVFERLVNLLFPEHCIKCDKYNTAFCNICLSTIPKGGFTEVENTYALFSYKDKYIHDSIWAMKYSNNKSFAKVFGTRLSEIIEEDIIEKNYFINSYILIPVPISKKKKRVRGYNQTEWLADSIIENLNSEIKNKITYRKDIIKRQHRDQTQARTRNKKNRLEQIEGAYYIAEDKRGVLKDKNIILIDDVTTTGGTIKEIKKILDKEKIASFVAYTVAH